MNAGQLTSADAVRTALFAGRATLTLVSKKTGTRYTFKVSRPNEGAPHFATLLTGPDNSSDFQYLGIASINAGLKLTAKSKLGADSAPVRALDWVLRQTAGGHLPDTVEVWHEGRCCQCGRKLTVPSSIATGLGPECAEKLAA